MNSINAPVKTDENCQNRTDTGQSPDREKITRLPKTHADYWFSRLRKRTYEWKGRQVEIGTWQVRLQHAGKEGWFNLGTANQAAAAKKAKDVYTFLQANGWDATIGKFKTDSDASPRLNVTVGEYLKAVKDTGYLRLRTFLNYQNCLRTIVSETFGVRVGDSKYDYRKGGNQDWAQRVDRIRLQRVTPAHLMAWQQRRIRKAGHSAAAVASAKRTCNSYVRCARSLFSGEVRQRLSKDVRLPAQLPFDGVTLFEQGSQKYHSRIDARALIAAAKNELKPNDPESFKTFLLALLAGMRKSEIDGLEWNMVDFGKNIIRLEPTEFLHLKTPESAGEITVDPEVIEELRGFMPASHSGFVIDSTVTWKNGKKLKTRVRPPRPDSARRYYRAEPVFQRLNSWLRGKGLKVSKKIHELRKEIGSLIATEHGIYAAAAFLRHSDITTTARHYADHKARISVGLGKLLDTTIKPVQPAAINP